MHLKKLWMVDLMIWDRGDNLERFNTKYANQIIS